MNESYVARRSEPAITYTAHLETSAAPVEVAPGVRGMRLPLPFALTHVNLWLLDDGHGLTAIDAGLGDQRTREHWEVLLHGQLRDRPIHRLIATHFHPDHMGLAGWLAAATGAPLWATRTEWLMGRLLALDTSEAFVDAGRVADIEAGLALETVLRRAQRGNAYRPKVVEPPATYRRIVEGEVIRIDGSDHEVLIGRGHAPEMVCLFCPERNVLIAADQVLARISPNVSVSPLEPEGDPLGAFLSSLHTFRRLPPDVLVLPSHGHPFRGLHARIDQLVHHHEERLERALDACREPATAVAIMPHLFDRKLDEHQLGFAIGETLAHLNYLWHQGRLEREPRANGPTRYRRRPA